MRPGALYPSSPELLCSGPGLGGETLASACAPFLALAVAMGGREGPLLAGVLRVRVCRAGVQPRVQPFLALALAGPPLGLCWCPCPLTLGGSG